MFPGGVASGAAQLEVASGRAEGWAVALASRDPAAAMAMAMAAAAGLTFPGPAGHRP
jgi:hypothetical protein